MTRSIRSLARFNSYCAAATLIAGAGLSGWSDCTRTNFNLVPLPDLGPAKYQSYTGGLYPNGANMRPLAHLAAGLQAAAEILPLNAAGTLDTNNGKVLVMSIGMSNTTQEWASKGTSNFKALADADPSKNPQVMIVDGAQGGQPATAWTNYNAATWSTAEQRLSTNGVTTNQVQVIWLKQANAGPTLGFPGEAQRLQSMLEQIARNAKRRYPNLKILYLSSRTRSYSAGAPESTLNPEPYAYESAFSVKWMIERQINGAADLNYDAARGPVQAPWLSWGPYIWADGTVGRSDGFVWVCTDTESDLTHPSANGGVPKVARQLLAFFKTDPTAASWFLKSAVTGQPPAATPTASVTNGFAPFSVNFAANASDADGTIRDCQWTFDDGTFSTNAAPVKNFTAPGVYTARLTVTDNSGDTTRRSLTILAHATVAAWKTNHFTAAELANPLVSGDTADPDYDNLPNLLEYALGRDPKTADPEAIGISVADQAFALTVPHSKIAGEVSLSVEFSSDLDDWTPVTGITQVLDHGSTESWLIQDNATGSARYFRLRAVRTP